MSEGHYPHGESLFPEALDEPGRLAIDGGRWATQAGTARFRDG